MSILLQLRCTLPSRSKRCRSQLHPSGGGIALLLVQRRLERWGSDDKIDDHAREELTSDEQDRERAIILDQSYVTCFHFRRPVLCDAARDCASVVRVLCTVCACVCEHLMCASAPPRRMHVRSVHWHTRALALVHSESTQCAWWQGA